MLFIGKFKELLILKNRLDKNFFTKPIFLKKADRFNQTSVRFFNLFRLKASLTFLFLIHLRSARQDLAPFFNFVPKEIEEEFFGSLILVVSLQPLLSKYKVLSG